LGLLGEYLGGQLMNGARLEENMSIKKGMEELLHRWEEELETLRRHGAAEAAATKAADIEDLRIWYREWQLEALSLKEAADYSGLASETLRKKISRGQTPNVGRGRPRVRRCDLPMRPPGPPVDPRDADSLAAHILAARRK
jgi:hypothetical protein